MNFESAVKYLKSFIAYDEERKIDYKSFNLKRIKDFFKDYGIDDSRLKYVHVGGSKGKGSVSLMIARYLSGIGLKTGFFTSPYLVDITESFWIDEKDMEKSEFVFCVEELKKFIEKSGGTTLTCFELMVVMAIKYFVDKGVEYAVLEVGLGGRVDPTNIIKPLVSVLTFVEKEHTDVLGKTLDKILDEKLGIVKNRVPFVVGPQKSFVRNLIEKKIGKNKEVYFVDELGSVDGGCEFENIAQTQNSATARAVLSVLFGEIDEKVFKKVMYNFKFNGRFDVRKIGKKSIVFDMAHTVNSVKNLVNSLKKKFPNEKFVFLFSAMKGKNVSAILKEILKISDEIVFTTAHEKRGYTGQELAVRYGKSFKRFAYCENPYEAYMRLLDKPKKDRILVITGSHFLIGKIFSKIK